MAEKVYDFGGWASEYGVLCKDGRTILSGAFLDQDGAEVPLVWGHDHTGPRHILGTAKIVHMDKGPYIYGSFNDTEDGNYARAAVNHGDIKYLSVFADHLVTRGPNRDVQKGTIKEVSLVPFGAANPGAYIDQAVIAHSDGTYSEADDEAYIVTGIAVDVDDTVFIEHGDGGKETKVAEDTKKKKEDNNDDEIDVQEVLDGMTDDQLAVLDYMMEESVRVALEDIAKGAGDDDDDDDEDDEADEKETAKAADAKGEGKADGNVAHSDEGGNMKYNAFEDNGSNNRRADYISHSDQAAILEMAKDRRYGSFKQAMKQFMEDHDYIQHDDEPTFVGGNTVVGGPAAVGGFDNSQVIDPIRGYTSFQTVLPEFQELNGNPPMQITPEWGWVDTVMSKVHKSPLPRVRTSYIDIREFEEDLRAKGYEKGNYKKYSGKIKIATRTTEPQTIYVKNALHKDDIDDMTNFDYVNYLYQIDQQMYKVELATAMLFGDGREDADEDKIKEDHIRPIWTDDDIYTIKYDITQDKSGIQGSNTTGYFGENFVEAEAMVNACLYSRETFKGTGTPDMFIEQRKLNTMLLARDRNGRRIYSSKSDLATALNVNNIFVCDKIKNKVREDDDGNQFKLIAILVNMADYNLGSTKGGQVTHITQFDIDFNQQKSLIEGRQSGALTKLYSAIVLEEKVTQSNP